jgi:hypothetical protein
MKNLQRIALPIFLALLIIGCTKNNSTSSSSCANVCEYKLASGETAATVKAPIIGTYNVTYTFADTDSPISKGTKATIEISANEMIITIEGKECVAIKNPFRTAGGKQDIFRDNCKSNLSYHISTKPDGSFNEVNVFDLGKEWYGQFTKD